MSLTNDSCSQSISAANLSESSLLTAVWSAIESQDIPRAITLCQQANRRFTQSANSWFATSNLAFRLKDPIAGLAAIDRAIELEPTKAQWQLHRVHLLLMKGDRHQASEAVTVLSAQKFTRYQDYADLALLLNKLGNHELSAAKYHQAIALTPDKNSTEKGQLHFNLASILRYLGRLDAAELSFDKAIELNPNDCEAYLQRASLRKQTLAHNHILQLSQKSRDKNNSPIGLAQIHYALAKEHEDLGHFSESFSALTSGARTRRQNMKYSLSGDLDTLESIITHFDSELMRQQHQPNQTDSGYSDDAPIFILGLPRTGSTLVERIVSSHSQVNNAGELNNFALAMMTECKKLTEQAPRSRSELVALSKAIDFTALGQAYIDSVRPIIELNGEGKRFIDKLPLNSLYVGLIHLALPDAKIIHVKRHPMDTCYAIYKQLFTSGYPFSYDLNELGQYYIAHQRLMCHWQELLPGVMHAVSYEDVLADLPGQARGLIDYCGLEWQEACVDFQHNRQASTTASASQVRQGLYKTSKGRWRSFATELASLREQLEAAGIDCR